MGVARDALYPAGEGYVTRGITFQLLPTTSYGPCREPPLTCDGDEILLHNHMVAEVGVAVEVQANGAAIFRMPDFPHLQTESGSRE